MGYQKLQPAGRGELQLPGDLHQAVPGSPNHDVIPPRGLQQDEIQASPGGVWNRDVEMLKYYTLKPVKHNLNLVECNKHN